MDDREPTLEPADASAATPAVPLAPEPPPKPRASRRKLVRWTAILLVVVAALAGAAYWWHEGELYVKTDNAYVNANTVEIAAQVTGPVTAVYVRDNQAVKAGEPLFDIDARPYTLALAKAEAQLQLARQQAAQESAAVSAAGAQVAQRQADLANAESNWQRTRTLVASGFLSQQGGVTARTQADAARAALAAAQANLAQARSALGETGNDNAAVRAAVSAVDQARLDLEHTHVTAPTAGTIANLTLRPGNTVAPGTPLFVLIGNQEFWVDANFKETELKRIRTGEPVTIESDVYPDHPFHGVVESVSGGAGTAFSLLPPQNATGNWVKVTQRVPVRIRVLDPDPNYPLRIGTSATVRVRTS